MQEDLPSHKCGLRKKSVNSKEALQDHCRKHDRRNPGQRRPPSKLGPPDLKKKCTLGLVQSSVTCDVCDAVFSTAAKAINHKWRMHPNQPSKFCCSYCGKHFTLKTIHDKHVEDEHSSSESSIPLHCDECNEQFFNEAARDYHSLITHRRVKAMLNPLVAPPPSKKIRISNAGNAESVYYCHLCGAEYISKFNLRKHLGNRHSNEAKDINPEMEVLRCTICEAIFFNLRAYEAHNLYHQPNDTYVVSEEHRLQTLTRVDLDFDARRVHIQEPKSIQGYAKLKMRMVPWDNTSQ